MVEPDLGFAAMAFTFSVCVLALLFRIICYFMYLLPNKNLS